MTKKFPIYKQHRPQQPFVTSTTPVIANSGKGVAQISLLGLLTRENVQWWQTL